MPNSLDHLNDNESVVVQFFTDMGDNAVSMRAAFEAYLTEDCVWENQGLPTAHGRAQIVEFLDQLVEQTGLQDVGGEVRAIASQGPLVLTERHERWLGRDGAVLVESLPVMGTFEVVEGRIRSWRDYFDPSRLAHLL